VAGKYFGAEQEPVAAKEMGYELCEKRRYGATEESWRGEEDCLLRLVDHAKIAD
jgi:hypothetical protein